MDFICTNKAETVQITRCCRFRCRCLIFIEGECAFGAPLFKSDWVFLILITDHIEVVKLSKQGCETSKETKRETEKRLKRRELMGEREVICIRSFGAWFLGTSEFYDTCGIWLFSVLFDKNSKSQRKLQWNSVNPTTKRQARLCLW